MKVTSTDFQQNVGRYQDAAQHAPVAINKNGRTHTVLVSAAFFEMVMKGRVAVASAVDRPVVRRIDARSDWQPFGLTAWMRLSTSLDL